MHAALDVIGDRLTPTPLGLLADKVDRISDEQFARIEALWRGRRVAVIFGPAGSGKSLVATELAMRFAAAGERVLYVLRNPFMAEWLNEVAGQDPRFQQAPYDIVTLKDLVQRIATQGGVQSDSVAGIDQTTWKGQNALRAILVDNQRALKAAGVPMSYTAVIVDDVEDIEQVLCIPLQNMLAQPHTGFYYTFGDETQRIDIETPWEWRPANWRPPALQMTEIWRNTRPIHEKLTQYQPRLGTLTFRGHSGLPIQYIIPGTAPKGKSPAEPIDDALNAALDDIFAAVPGIREEEIMVVSARAQTKSRWYRAEARALSRRRLQWLGDGKRAGKVALTTIRSAKGMECKAIILAELDGLAPNDKKRDNRLYLAISRALWHLVVLGTEADISPTAKAR
jgi:RecA/RadA recombinase